MRDLTYEFPLLSHYFHLAPQDFAEMPMRVIGAYRMTLDQIEAESSHG